MQSAKGDTDTDTKDKKPTAMLRALSARLEHRGAAAEAALLGEGLVLQWRAPALPAWGGLHGMHRYLAPLQRAAIDHWLRGPLLPPRGTFLDPFCGAGSTLDAAAFAPGSRWQRVVGCDLSPLAVSVARGHCAAFAAATGGGAGRGGEEVAAAATALHSIETSVPAVARRVSARLVQRQWRVEHGGAWAALQALLEEEVAAADDAAAVTDALWFVFSALRHRYGERAARRRVRRRRGSGQRGGAAGPSSSVGGRFEAAARAFASAAAALDPARVARVSLHCADTRLLGSELAAASCDAVLTSPPYPGVYDYLSAAREAQGAYLVRSLPSWPAGDEIAPFSELKRSVRRAIRRGEAGAEAGDAAVRLVDSLRHAPERAKAAKLRAEEGREAFVSDWQADTDCWVRELGQVLRVGGRAIVVVGDGAGVDTLGTFERAAARCRSIALVASASIASTESRPALRGVGKRRPEHAILLERV